MAPRRTYVLAFLIPAMILGDRGLASGTVEGLVVEIVDGDTFTLLTPSKEQVSIRVAEIDAPERGQPYGTRARQQLAALIFNKSVTIQVQVVDNYGRLVGRPIVDEVDVSAEMVRAGAAWVYRTYSEDVDLYELEKDAREEKQGLWGLSDFAQIPPWRWRNGERSIVDRTDVIRSFQCGAKTYCRQMVSCDEAKFHLESCMLTRLDGDEDGVPCETLCQ